MVRRPDQFHLRRRSCRSKPTHKILCSQEQSMGFVDRSSIPGPPPRSDRMETRLCCDCSGRLLAHRVESLWCEGSDAIGAKRTCRERRERVDLTKMTQSGSEAADFCRKAQPGSWLGCWVASFRSSDTHFECAGMHHRAGYGQSAGIMNAARSTPARRRYFA